MPHSNSVIAESGARLRTRRAILDAAVTVLRENAAASLADIAEAARVGRTTVHRYFPERSDLIAALRADIRAKVDTATRDARPADGPAGAALSRLCQEYFAFGDLFGLCLTMPELSVGPDRPTDTAADRGLAALVARGHTDGTIDPALDAAWIQRLVWCLVAGAHAHAAEAGVPGHQALTLCLHTLTKAITP